ncbi:MAG: hypothetical protein U1C74_10760 [Phenylobacterium sp.]|nr:hypothetical protein [Phenylobacterium sp.]
MRGLIRASAILFIGLGVATVALAAVAALGAFGSGAYSASATYPEMLSLVIALAGLLSGASIVLVGGTAYLLASIDERLEHAVASDLRK